MSTLWVIVVILFILLVLSNVIIPLIRNRPFFSMLILQRRKLDDFDIQILSALSKEMWTTGREMHAKMRENLQKSVSVGVLYNRIDFLEKRNLIEVREAPGFSYEFRLSDEGGKQLKEFKSASL